ncbi:uncharacterized protein LOC143253277 [Tachypleus tridentatus]|uniref:uncharacterized protein LOC143253277 n=1 Tax=Tachypleus tridentatus TaxID=6853 RepID=UPI003FD3CA73
MKYPIITIAVFTLCWWCGVSTDHVCLAEEEAGKSTVTTAAQPSLLSFNSLLKAFEEAEWDVIFVKMLKIVINYFMDKMLTSLFGTAGRQSSPTISSSLFPVSFVTKIVRQRRAVVGEGLRKEIKVCNFYFLCRVGQSLAHILKFEELVTNARNKQTGGNK